MTTRENHNHQGYDCCDCKKEEPVVNMRMTSSRKDVEEKDKNSTSRGEEGKTQQSFIAIRQEAQEHEQEPFFETSGGDDGGGAISAPQTNVVTFQYPTTGLVVENVRLHDFPSPVPPPPYAADGQDDGHDDDDQGTYAQSTKEAKTSRQQQQQRPLDFIGPSAAVKDIFGLPYSADVGVAIAVHNLGNGTLLIDGAVIQDDETCEMNRTNHHGTSKIPAASFRNRKRPRSSSSNGNRQHLIVNHKTKNNNNNEDNGGDGANISSSLSTVSSSPPLPLPLPSQDEFENYQEKLLGYISDMIQTQTKYLPMVVPKEVSCNVDKISVNPHEQSGGCFEEKLNQQYHQQHHHQQQQQQQDEEDGTKNKEPHEALGYILPPPEDYTEHLLHSSSTVSSGNHYHQQHRFYQPWKFQKYNLLVGSDALVVKPIAKEDKDKDKVMNKEDVVAEGQEGPLILATTTTMTSTTKGNELNHDMTLTIRVVDCDALQSKLTQTVQSTGKSYAQVLCNHGNKKSLKAKDDMSHEHAIVPYPDFARLSLQSCVLPSPDFQHQLHRHGFSARPVGMGDLTTDTSTTNNNTSSTSSSSSSSSPICMVLDAYLDNVIANVPQLALCLQERGLIQAVKIFETKELPNLSSKDLLMSHGFSAESELLSPPGVLHSKPLFSKSVVESNAALMLDFLKTNCCRENSTYLLTRNAGETKVQLLDVTSLSKQRQRKWIYWLAMISMRFAMRLENIGKEYDCNESSKREYRQKKRGLLENALELLHELADMGGGNYETIRASVYEQLADSFLLSNTTSCDGNVKGSGGGQDSSECSFLLSGNVGIENMVYNHTSIDSLSKASDFLKAGIKIILRPLETALEKSNTDDAGVSVELEALSLQIYGLHHKLINVSLSLANKYLLKYRSSSVMQSLRLSARSISETASLFLRIINMSNQTKEFIGHESEDFILSLIFQYSLLMENCGNFARSFAADTSWRERGHACGEDIIALLRDVELLSHPTNKVLRDYSPLSKRKDFFCITSKSKGIVNLDYLSGVIPISEEGDVDTNAAKSVDRANEYLESQKQLRKDKRRVLVAACLAYGQAADVYSQIGSTIYSSKSRIWPVLLQRFGDATNEIGKILLDDVQIIMRKDPRSDIIHPLLLSSEWWFKEGLEVFDLCGDVRNTALLRCNLSQCCKIRSSSSSSRMSFRGRYDCLDRNLDSHTEVCLNDAARHLELAHEALDQRNAHDSRAWDMVSLELASIYLLLGVRRRQLLIGQGSSLITNTLNPGTERSIITPIKRARDIYLSLGIDHKVAAADYQLALYYAKIWTCQRDETLTKEKLSKAFSYFGQAHKYFFTHTESNEDTLVCLLLDLCSLYSTTSTSYECQEKALLCCLDSCRAFSVESVKRARNHSTDADWFAKMDSLNDKMEDRILGLLASLVKMEKHDRHLPSRYEPIYRRALEIKLGSNSERMHRSGAYRVFEILNVIKTNHLGRKS
mmetsp:Transcript_870/g.1503  ORF Transcript_870/g.1503 Transcript_870/m.1503 type:complete len:1474 (-) Transcript_870:5-4426(-)